MKSLVFFIPAQQENKYHKLGDLAPFGDTTLLQWKISQCKKIVDNNCIYVSSSSDMVEEIVKKESVNYIKRKKVNIEDEIKLLANSIKEDVIIWTSATSPFLSEIEYMAMYSKFNTKGCDLLISTIEKKDYGFYNDIKINFNSLMVRRDEINPIYLCTNGAYILNKKFILQKENILDTDNIFLYKLDKFSAIEIKDLTDYSISKELISTYFENKLGN
jgi:CMP-N-acetylneuraminic acid synthetase